VWFLRGNVWQYWARHLERFGSPQWVGKAATGFDPATGKTNAESMAEMLAYAVASGVVVVGNDEEAQAVDVSGNGGASFETADKRIAGRIQKRILGQTLTTETSGTGSYAMASVHDDVRQEIAAADIALITPAIQAIVNSLVELNYPGTVPPIFAIEHQTGLNEDRAKRDVDLYGQGVRFTQEYYTRVYDFDAAEITIDSTQPARPMQFKHIPQQANRFMFADNQPVDQGQLELDAMLSDALQQAGSSIEADALKAIVLKAKNPDDLADRLVKFYDETTPDGNYVDTLAALLFAADVLGYEQADMGVIE
jgi:phage gp29-like protein